MASLWEHLDEEDRHGLILCSGLTICIAGAWIYLGAEPHDLSAYRYGAELFWSGENPYIKTNMVAPHYQGYPYVYMPFTRWIIAPLALLPAAAWIILLTLARMSAIALAARTASKALSLPVKWPSLFLLASALFHPFFIDSLAGNLATLYLGLILALWSWLAFHTDRESAPAISTQILLGLTAGALLAIKPTWLLPAMILTVGFRHIALSASILLASGAAFAYSHWGSGMWEDWVAMMRAIDAAWPKHDLFHTSPLLFSMVAILWGILALKPLKSKDSTALLVLASSSVIVWPRQSGYSFALLFIAALFVIRRIRWPHAAILLLPAITPLPWVLRMQNLSLFGLGILPLWGTLIGLLALFLLSRPADQDREENKEATS